MENLEEVVRERNRAYFQLEVGTSGEQERHLITGPFGLDVGYLQREHVVPWEYNSGHRAGFRYRYGTVYGKQVLAFYRRYREKVFKELRRTRL
jgi:large subunit ribosomal protein L47